MSYALFLDDIRKPLSTKHVDLPPYNWTVVRSYDEFVKTITQRGLPFFITFDHDLAAGHYPQSQRETSDNFIIQYDTMKEKTGYHCALWLIEYCQKNKLPLPGFGVHSMNPAGKKNIEQVLLRYKQIQQEENDGSRP